MIKIFCGLHVKHRCSFLISMKLNFLESFQKIIKYQISWTSVKWEPSCTLRKTNRRTDMTELIFPPRNSASAPKNVDWYAAYILRMSRKYLKNISEKCEIICLCQYKITCASISYKHSSLFTSKHHYFAH
jgi:hypothetical protein